MQGIPLELQSVLVVDPEVVGGEPCFIGTRVPLETVLDNLADGLSVDDLLDHYPTLRRAHVEAVLAWQYQLARTAAGLGERRAS
jgi:uncharacterized protein (DUF433 family)